ncbi:hypothetical protein [Luteimonas qiangzhengi]|uniref:hypothetical protein n=1 Tax=Luteimonas sp. MJ146 TaxID=3129240 RepID=UPI0031BA57CD
MATDSTRSGHGSGQSSTLPFDPADLVKMRVTPARFATMCSVSRQAVSKWIKKGWVTLGPDGLLDPAIATRQYLDHVDPARMQARILKGATATHAELRARIQSLEAAAANAVPKEELAKRLDRLVAMIIDAFDFGPVHPDEARTMLSSMAIRYVMEPAQNDSRDTDQETLDEED